MEIANIMFPLALNNTQWQGMHPVAQLHTLMAIISRDLCLLFDSYVSLVGHFDCKKGLVISLAIYSCK